MTIHVRGWFLLPILLCISGCLLTQEQERGGPLPNKRPPLEDYQPLDLKKFSSGLYNEEFKDKYVRVDGIYGGSLDNPGEGDISRISFAVGPWQKGEGYAAVYADRSSMRDTIYALNPGDHVIVYGRVDTTLVPGHFKNRPGEALTIFAHHIEPVRGADGKIEHR